MRHRGNPIRLPAALAMAAIVAVVVAGGSYAMWQRSQELAGPVPVGASRFAVGDPTADSSPLPAPYATTWTMPVAPLGDVDEPIPPAGIFTAAIQVDGVSEGNRGMSYALTGVQVADPAGSGYLASFLSLELFAIEATSECQPAAEPAAAPLFAGPLAAARTSAQELLAPDSTPPGASVFLCARFTLDPQFPTSYRNVGSATGNADDAGGVRVEASSPWNARLTIPAAAFTPSVTFTFASTTYREGQEP